jgi:hypothetical protein
MGQASLAHGSAAALSRIPISRENLPVLAAFQEFLELERRRTRNNIIALSLFFSFILFACILSAYFIGNALIRQMKTDLYGLESDVRSTRTDTMATLDKIKQQSDSLNDKITSQNAKITVELNKGLSGQMTEISSVKKTTTELQQENEALKKELEKIRHAIAAMTAPGSPDVNPEVRKVLGVGMTSLSDTYAQARILTYDVNPPGGAKKVAWLLPIILE